ncbi:MAG: type II toxin-antitoxin system VapC family toxin [Exilibacterium sp.]
MIAVDTNVVVRLLTRDDPEQYRKSFTLFNAQTIYLSLTVMQETEWVLRFSYEFSPDKINFALLSLAGLANVEIEKPQILAKALSLHGENMDFSDALHLAQSSKCDSFYTFDKKLINKAMNNGICEVRKP